MPTGPLVCMTLALVVDPLPNTHSGDYAEFCFSDTPSQGGGVCASMSMCHLPLAWPLWPLSVRPSPAYLPLKLGVTRRLDCPVRLASLALWSFATFGVIILWPAVLVAARLQNITHLQHEQRLRSDCRHPLLCCLVSRRILQHGQIAC